LNDPVTGYGFGWQMGEDKLAVTSVGTGRANAQLGLSTGLQSLAAAHGIKALSSVLEDCADLVETMMQWMSRSQTAREIDRELGDLRNDSMAPEPLLTYLRYNVLLTGDSLASLGMALPHDKVETLSVMDDPDNMATLQEVGARAAQQQVRAGDFPASFDLS